MSLIRALGYPRPRRGRGAGQIQEDAPGVVHGAGVRRGSTIRRRICPPGSAALEWTPPGFRAFDLGDVPSDANSAETPETPETPDTAREPDAHTAPEPDASLETTDAAPDAAVNGADDTADGPHRAPERRGPRRRRCSAVTR